MIDALQLTKTTLPSQPARAEIKAGQEFEAVLLTNFVEQMLPQNIGGSIDGSDKPQAGADVWRSFMARAVADELAKQNITGVSALISGQLADVRRGLANGA